MSLPSNLITAIEASRRSKTSDEALLLGAIMCEIRRASSLGMESIVAYLSVASINTLTKIGYEISAERFSFVENNKAEPKYRCSVQWHNAR